MSHSPFLTSSGGSTSNGGVYARPHTISRNGSALSRRSSAPASLPSRIRRRIFDLNKKWNKMYWSLTPLQRIALSVVGVSIFAFSILSLVFHQRLFAWLLGTAKGWREIRGGWTILWVVTFVVSFPPLFGYSTCVTLGGFVYGFPSGWFIVATASTLGATAAFLLSRSVLRSYVARLTASDSRFQALSLVLKHDGLKLLCMLRLCPIPFSLANGAISTIPTVSWQMFLLSTALASPKLLLHVFIGHQLAQLAEHNEEMDAKTRIISYTSIAFGSLVGIATGWVIYARTKRRSAELAALERQEAGGEGGNEYEDEPERDDGDLREEADDISLRETWDDDDYFDDRPALGSLGGGGRNGSYYKDVTTPDANSR